MTEKNKINPDNHYQDKKKKFTYNISFHITNECVIPEETMKFFRSFLDNNFTEWCKLSVRRVNKRK